MGHLDGRAGFGFAMWRCHTGYPEMMKKIGFVEKKNSIRPQKGNHHEVVPLIPKVVSILLAGNSFGGVRHEKRGQGNEGAGPTAGQDWGHVSY